MSDSQPNEIVSAEQLQRQAAYSGDPWKPSNPYFNQAEASMPKLWERLIYPMIKNCDFRSVLDLAAGHGRNSTMLLPLCQHLSIMDIQAGNVEVCRERFADNPSVTLYTNNGYDLKPLADGSLTLIYCFDAMVHFESDVVRSYLRDSARVLETGGRGFFHHSNYAGGSDWRTNPGSRNFMTKEIFADFAHKEGLKLLDQQVINWSVHQSLDCLTLIEK